MSYDSDHVSIVITKTPEPENCTWAANGRRWQPYHWAAITPNGRTLAVASERYTNRDDMLAAVGLLFGGGVPVRIVVGDQLMVIPPRTPSVEITTDGTHFVARVRDTSARHPFPQVPNGHAEAADCDPDYPATEVQG
jgi:hypothetical protein